jgi:V8-like Glu-specific endopeptidase
VGEPFLLTSEEVYPGHSGSPIFNENGEVIGIIFASFPTYGGIGIPVGDIHKFLQDANNFDFINDFNFIQ